MIDTKLFSLVDRLLKRTQDGLLNWEETAYESRFQVSLPNQSIDISQYTESFGSLHVLSIYNQEGKLLEQIDEDEIPSAHRDVSNKLQELYELARRKALNTEEEIDALLNALDDEELLSNLSSKKPPSQPPLEGDDIPF